MAEPAVVAKLRKIPSLQARSDGDLLLLGYYACTMTTNGHDGDDVAMTIAYDATITERDAEFLLKVALPALCPSVME